MAFHGSCVPIPLVRTTHLRLNGNIRRLAYPLGWTIKAEAHTDSGSLRSPIYPPSSWDYKFLQSLTHDSPNEMHTRRHEELKERVRHRILGEPKLVSLLELIDVVQRLGLGYHFDEEIKDVLGSISVEDATTILKKDLHAIALMFRLLREHGFKISQDVFNGFKDNKGGGYKGVLSLYEASHLAFEGETTLDEARKFTTRQLTSLKPAMDPRLRKKVEHALELPLRWRARRLEARQYIDEYESDEGMDPVLLQLAKLDFNKVQSIHRKEIGNLSRWWEKRGLGHELGFFSRDRLVECFFFTAGIVPEPHLSFCRQRLTQIGTLILVLDDVYDHYGSLEDLRLFTRAVNGWENKLVEQLPHYMKTCYSALYNTINKLAGKILIEEGWDASSYLKSVWVDLCNSFFLESKWKYEGYTPTFEEYINNGWISGSGPVVLFHVLILSRQGVTQEALEYMRSYPSHIHAPSMIIRLCNDLATSTVELERGGVSTSLQCYMNKYGVSEENGRQGINNLINEEWKKLNKVSIDYSPFPRYFMKVAIDIARITHCIYQNCDGFSDPNQEKKNQIMSLFFEPIEL